MTAVSVEGRLVCADGAEAAIVRGRFRRHVELTRAEPGCLRFDVDATDDPLVWVVSELFADRAAFDSHQARLRASEWGEATSGVAREYVITVVGE
ncbi:antibiotic biosynthesis monooxygenase [Gordonia sinesedis]